METFQQSADPVMDEHRAASTPACSHDSFAHRRLLFCPSPLSLLCASRAQHPHPLRRTTQHHCEAGLDGDPVVILVRDRGALLPALFLQLNTPQADLTVKATGKQWFWTYSYPDNGKFEFAFGFFFF